jgi:CHAD domain-containing protein/HD superfamily phosphodiesterase
MLQVLEECERVSADFSADPVHDLRVALRRCRSLADGLNALDPDPEWKAMKKAGRALFQRLGALRDVQVMMEWVETLAPKIEKKIVLDPTGSLETNNSRGAISVPDNDPAEALLEILQHREREQQHEARAALAEFDRKQWRQWSKSLPARAARIRAGSPLFKHLAIERWTEARELHARALRNRSQVALHSLRIGIKRFRYILENFLPAEHRAWKDGLKEIQDLLGEIHDLDVLWTTASSCHIFPGENARQSWHNLILAERAKRVEQYRGKMLGPDSLWQVWRAGLPQGQQVVLLATRRMKFWASHLDPDFPHSERVAALALQLFDGLVVHGWQPALDAASARASLFAAALLHDVGKSEGQKGRQKTSFDLIRSHGTPLGWKPEEMQRAALVARFHRGALPTRRHKTLRDLLPNEQKAVIQLAAILRLANALDTAHDGHVQHIKVESDGLKARSNAPLIIVAEGYSPVGKSAMTVAAERHLLETVLQRAVIVSAVKPADKKLARGGSIQTR